MLDGGVEAIRLQYVNDFEIRDSNITIMGTSIYDFGKGMYIYAYCQGGIIEGNRFAGAVGDSNSKGIVLGSYGLSDIYIDNNYFSNFRMGVESSVTETGNFLRWNSFYGSRSAQVGDWGGSLTIIGNNVCGTTSPNSIYDEDCSSGDYSDNYCDSAATSCSDVCIDTC